MAGKKKVKPNIQPKDVTVRIVHRKGQRRAGFHTTGKSTPMRLGQFVASLLEANEILERSRKMTDRTMVAAIVSEYPNSITAQKLGDGRLTMGYYRALFNNGNLTCGIKPLPRSKRYSERGYPCDGWEREFKSLAENKQKAKRLQERHNKREADAELEMDFNAYAKDLANALCWYSYEFIKDLYSWKWTAANRRRGPYKPRSNKE